MYYKYISKVTIWPAEDKIAIPVFQSSSNFITSSMFEYGGWHRFSIEIDSHGGSTNSNSVNKNLQRPALIPLEFIISIMKQHKHKRQRFYFNYESSTWISYSSISSHHKILTLEASNYKGSKDFFLAYSATLEQRFWLSSLSKMFPVFPKVIMQNGVNEQPSPMSIEWYQRPAL